MSYARKKLQAEYEAELQVARLDLQNERTATAALRRQIEHLQAEMSQISSKLAAFVKDILFNLNPFRKILE